MIQLTRWRIRRICDVLRATVWAASRDASLPVLIHAGPEGLTISSQHKGLAVAYQQPGNFAPQTFVVPGKGLETLAGYSANPVFLESLGRGDVKVTWLAEGRGWRRVDDWGDVDSLSLPPPPPVPYVTNRLAPHGLRALHDAMMTASPWHPVWSRIELRGSGVVAATDGKQVLLQTGFNFPWTDDLLVPRTEVFDCVDFQQCEAKIGRTDSHVVIQAGGWTVALPIDKQGRFPRVEAGPSPREIASTASAPQATGKSKPRKEFPRQAVLARHPITGWLTVFVIDHTGEREEQILGPDGITPLTEYFEECLKKYGLLGVAQQMEEQRRLAEQMQVSLGWLRGAYTEWLTSCQQFTEDTGSEVASVRRELCGGGITRTAELPFPTQPQQLRPAGFGVLRWWEQAEQYRREALERRRLSEDQERRQREEWQAEVRASAEQRRRWQEQREAARRRRQEEDARKDIDVTFLGHGVSAGLSDRRSDIEKLTAAGLPVLSTPAELAQAIGLTIPQLRWLAYHTSVTSRVHYVSFTISKKGGGERTLHAPLHLMGRAQRWVLENILDKLSVEEPCHGFRAGRGTVTNAAPHAGQAVVVNMDLAGFFPSIGFRRVRSVFERLGYSPAVATILGLLCTACPRREELIGRERRFVAIGPRGLPQGACTSPALANQVTRRLDRRLDGLAKSLNGAYTRYADDLSFSGGEEMLERIGYLMTKVRLIVTEEGFTVNEKKTRVQRRHSAQRVTGLVVNDRPGVVRREVRRLRAILHRARTEGLEKQNREGHENFLAWLHGKIGYVCMARPEAGARLQAELRAILNQEVARSEKTEIAEEESQLQPQGAELP